MRFCAILMVMITLPLGCSSTNSASANRAISQPVILPASMCARGFAAASNDPKGDRMICEFEEPLGSHIPKCICHDEQEIVATREETQQALHDMEINKCVAHGGGTCAAGQ
jgi:hypothetical protein